MYVYLNVYILQVAKCTKPVIGLRPDTPTLCSKIVQGNLHLSPHRVEINAPVRHLRVDVPIPGFRRIIGEALDLELHMV